MDLSISIAVAYCHIALKGDKKMDKGLTGYPSIDKPWLQYYSEEAINALLPRCTVYELLWENNKEYLDDSALNYYGRKFTYGQLFDSIERTAKSFSALGVKAGDIVVICTVNTPEMVYAFYALNRLGAISNMVDPRTNIDGLHEYILESDAKFVMTVDLAYPAIAKAAEGTSIQKIVVVSPADSLPPIPKMLYQTKNKHPKFGAKALPWKTFESLGAGITPVYASYVEDSCCVIAHTGGTTGFPKGVMLSNDNVNAMTHGYRHIGVPYKRKDRYFNDLPPFIMYGLCLATHTTLSYGLEVILYPVFDSQNFPKQFKKYRPHHFCAVPDHLRCLATSNVTRSLDFSETITVGVGGDALDHGLEQKMNGFLKSHGCQYEVMKGYGMTELAATAVVTFPGANAIGSVGVPLVSNTVKIMDAETHQELRYNQTGEIWIAGPSVMLGYYNKPQETDDLIFTDETGVRWVRTGDLGHMTEDGLLFHEGRIRRIYLTMFDGQPAKIFPMLVENVLNQSQAVRECSVVGRKRRNSDNYEAVAFVVKTGQAGNNEILMKCLNDLCEKSVPTYMIPVEYYFIDQLPHTPIGKVDFCTLEHMAAENIQ